MTFSTSMARRAQTALRPVAGLVIAVGIWHLALATGFVPPGSLPDPAEVAGQLAQMLLGDPETWAALWQTLWSAVVGLAIAVGVGLVLGTAIGRLRFVDASTNLLVQFLRPIPPIALLPLMLLLLGPSPEMKLILIAWGAVWPVLLQTADGVKSIDPLALQVTRSYHISRLRAWRSVIVPAMLPYIMTGLRVSASVSLLVAVMAELIGGADGIGKMTANAGIVGQTSTVYAYVLLAGLLGVLLNAALSRLERRVLFWHESCRLNGRPGR